MKFIEAYNHFSKMWESPFRFYHTKENHLDKILPFCETIELKYFALFHDIVYGPYSRTNEEDSVALFTQNIDLFDDLNNPQLVIDMIMATKNHDMTGNADIDKAIEIDMYVLKGKFQDLLKYEKDIFKEYQRTDIDTYIEKRTEFLSKYKDIGHINELIDYISTQKYSIGLYAGSFDPFHIGHLDILKKAEEIFDKVIIVRAENPEKPEHKYPMPRSVPNQIIEHKGLITDLFNKDRAKYTLIRGIRNEYDIASEMNYMAWVHEINKDVPFVHIFCDQDNIKVSSSTLKSFTKIDGFDISRWIVK
jgi:pantetheine-phosphate adenylyltransferase